MSSRGMKPAGSRTGPFAWNTDYVSDGLERNLCRLHQLQLFLDFGYFFFGQPGVVKNDLWVNRRRGISRIFPLRQERTILVVRLQEVLDTLAHTPTRMTLRLVLCQSCSQRGFNLFPFAMDIASLSLRQEAHKLCDQ